MKIEIKKYWHVSDKFCYAFIKDIRGGVVFYLTNKTSDPFNTEQLPEAEFTKIFPTFELIEVAQQERISCGYRPLSQAEIEKIKNSKTTKHLAKVKKPKIAWKVKISEYVSTLFIFLCIIAAVISCFVGAALLVLLVLLLRLIGSFGFWIFATTFLLIKYFL